ncbi:MAG: hypothetical protein WB511_06840, partial [Nitrososphaeraceae archaeon]
MHDDLVVYSFDFIRNRISIQEGTIYRTMILWLAPWSVSRINYHFIGLFHLSAYKPFLRRRS